MLRYTTGNILSSDNQALVNTVNTVGVMGKGIALSFKNAFPIVDYEYQKAIKEGEIKVGRVQVIKTNLITPEYIINFPTKKHWRQPSKLGYIDSGLQDLVKAIQEYKINSISIPPLGCGNGKLPWQRVKPLMECYLEPLSMDVEILIFEPGFNDQQSVDYNKKVHLTPARAMLLYLMNEYQILGYSINLLVAQKLAYFLQRFGEPLNLQYEKGYYGPYAHRLFHLLKYLNGSFIRFKEENNNPGTINELPRGKPRSIRIISVVLQIFSHRSFLGLQRIS
ncbi:MAG TPA: phosphatase [Bacteroides sp.]|nr:phosphatase [Bacteroides sp.]